MADLTDFDRCCHAITSETELLCADVRDADLTLPVPDCPGWNLGHLLRHVGGTQRWAEQAVRTRAAAPVPDDQVNDVTGYGDKDPVALAKWLAEGAEQLAATLREAGPDTPVWAPAPPRTALFWARRLAAETMVHRGDAARAAGAPYRLEPEVALLGLEEWLGNSVLPQAAASEEQRRELLGPGRTVHLHATDGAGEWLLDLSGDDILMRRAHEKAAAAVRGPAAELLQLVYFRRGLDGDGLEVFGDAELFTRWRHVVSDWTRRA